MASAQLKRLEKRLAAVPKAVKEAVLPALEKCGEELAETMRQLAPEETGALKESVEVTTAGNMTPAYSQPGGSTIVPENAVLVTVGNDAVRYPHLVEHGTKHREATPFFWPAFRLLKKRLDNRIKRTIRKAVKEGWQA